jgi:hypothetical protein
VTLIVRVVIFTLLEDLDAHSRKDVALRQRILDLEEVLDGAFARNREFPAFEYGRERLGRH